MGRIRRYTRVAYVIGPFRAEHDCDRVQNIREAEALSHELWRMGYVVICAHMNTMNLEGVIPDDDILLGDMEILKRCDFAVTTRKFSDPKIKNSKGSQGEIKYCKKIGKPVYETISVMKLYEDKIED